MHPISLHGVRLKRCPFVYTYVRAALPRGRTLRDREHVLCVRRTERWARLRSRACTGHCG